MIVSEGFPVLSTFYEETTEGKKFTRIDGVLIGKITGFSSAGGVLVDFPGYGFNCPVPARSTVAFGKKEVGRDVALMFEAGDPQKPIIMGLIQHPGRYLSEEQVRTATKKDDPVEVSVDGERVTLSAKKEIVLRCGKASITLTRAGKVLIRGAYLLNRSSGVNRIKGGSVQIN